MTTIHYENFTDQELRTLGVRIARESSNPPTAADKARFAPVKDEILRRMKLHPVPGVKA